MCRERVPQRTASQKRHRRQPHQRKFDAQTKHYHKHDDDLQDCYCALIDPVDEDAFNCCHIFQDSRHQIPSSAIIEPAQGEQLNVRIKIASQIENDFLLERIVDEQAQRVQPILEDERNCTHQQQREQKFAIMPVDDLVDDLSRHHRCDDDHRRAGNCTSQHRDPEHRVAF